MLADSDFSEYKVTILILIDGFLQLLNKNNPMNSMYRHNPYFNRWFSAIQNVKTYEERGLCHNPYFNRWFSAIKRIRDIDGLKTGHNPYFNRWFSAIFAKESYLDTLEESQSLF